MSKEYYTLRELIDNNGGLLNEESLHFIAKHGLLFELLLCDNRLGEEAFLALPTLGYVPNSKELACFLYMRGDLDCKMMSALNLTDAVMLELLCLDLSLLPAVRAKGLFWRISLICVKTSQELSYFANLATKPSRVALERTAVSGISKYFHGTPPFFNACSLAYSHQRTAACAFA